MIFIGEFILQLDVKSNNNLEVYILCNNKLNDKSNSNNDDNNNEIVIDECPETKREEVDKTQEKISANFGIIEKITKDNKDTNNHNPNNNSNENFERLCSKVIPIRQTSELIDSKLNKNFINE